MVKYIVSVAAVIAAYLAGNISPAIILGRASGVDIKKEGSGNAGTTNVLRVLGKKAAVVTLVIDIGKGVIAVLIGKACCTYIPDVTQYLGIACGFAVMCGHIWPALYKFRGGKGVATAFGVLTAISPKLGFSALLVVAVIVLITRYVSAGSVCGAIAAPFLAYIFVPDMTIGVFMMAVIVIYKHRSNIKRLFKGEESKLSFKSVKRPEGE